MPKILVLIRQVCKWFALAMVLLLVPTSRSWAEHKERLSQLIRHELVMLPYYGVFDNLEYRVEGSAITLQGQVHRPSLKASAETTVRGIEGVEEVRNLIEILPTSPQDDRIRRDAFRAIYDDPSFTKYAFRAVPPIHIVVSNGNVTLTGVVATDGDKNLAGLRVNGVSGVFSVTNSLRVENAGG